MLIADCGLLPISRWRQQRRPRSPHRGSGSGAGNGFPSLPPRDAPGRTISPPAASLGVQQSQPLARRRPPPTRSPAPSGPPPWRQTGRQSGAQGEDAPRPQPSPQPCRGADRADPGTAPRRRASAVSTRGQYPLPRSSSGEHPPLSNLTQSSSLSGSTALSGSTVSSPSNGSPPKGPQHSGLRTEVTGRSG